MRADMAALTRDIRREQVAPAMGHCGVAVSMAVQARTSAQETPFLLKLAATDPQIVGVVGWVDLRAADVAEQLEAWSGEDLLKGFRHILQDEVDLAHVVNDQAFNAGVTLLQNQAWVYDVLVFDHQIHEVLDFCARHDRHHLVLDHVGKPCIRGWGEDDALALRWKKALGELAAMPHVSCKLSGLVTEADWSRFPALRNQDAQLVQNCFDHALQVFGPQRLMFGSDWPVCQLAASYETVFGLAEQWAHAQLSEAEQMAFWGQNAQRIYQLNI